MGRIYNWMVGVALIMCVAIPVCAASKQAPKQTSKKVKQSVNYKAVVVQRVVDGDTVKLSGGERVRLIGIDTPEVHESLKLYRDAEKSKTDIKTIQAMGRKSSDFTRKLVEGKKVRLEFDVEKRDRHGRLLAYIYLPEGTFVNAEIIKQGYASPMTVQPNVKYQDLFLKLYKEARASKRGLWKD